VYDLTIFKLHCGRLTLKVYTKGERVLRIEAVVHDAKELRCGRSLDNFARLVAALKGILKRFMDALSCIDQCFIADDLLERLPAASQVGKTKVGGIDLNKPRMRQVAEALIALSASPHGFTASELAARVRALGKQTQSIRSPPRRLRSEKTPWQTNRPPDRSDTPLRADPDGSESNDRAGRPRKQSNQTSARGRSGTHTHPRTTEPTSHRRTLRCDPHRDASSI
jgi:hypothetical protein